MKALQRALLFQLAYLYRSHFQYLGHYPIAQVFLSQSLHLQVRLSLFQCPQVRLIL